MAVRMASCAELAAAWLHDGWGNPRAVLADTEECHANGAAPSVVPRTGKERVDGPIYEVT